MIPADFIPYKLTPEQVASGWVMKRADSSIRYLHNDQHSDPAPGVPAWQEWTEDGRWRGRSHFQQGQLQDQNR